MLCSVQRFRVEMQSRPYRALTHCQQIQLKMCVHFVEMQSRPYRALTLFKQVIFEEQEVLVEMQSRPYRALTHPPGGVH